MRQFDSGEARRQFYQRPASAIQSNDIMEVVPLAALLSNAAPGSHVRLC